MNPLTRRQLALGLTLGPWAIVGVMYLFGSKPVAFHWEGSFPPTGLSFEINNSGILLVPLSFGGLVWLIVVSLRRRKTESDQTRT